jgi:NAD(P)-dependent dehydrogenase (short-subunit alcohol dehydrogenase family)
MVMAVITGAASGMGRECVETMRAYADAVEAPAIEGSIGVTCDIADHDGITAFVGKVRDPGGF